MVMIFVISLFHLKSLLLKSKMTDLEQVDSQLIPQYVQGEEEFVTKYIYLENFYRNCKSRTNISIENSPYTH